MDIATTEITEEQLDEVFGALAGRTAQGSRRMAGGVPGVLGGELRAARRAARRDPRGAVGPSRPGKEFVMTELKVTAEPDSHEVRTEREIDAPRNLVFRA